MDADVEIHPTAIIHPGVEIGRGSKVEAFCELGVPTPLADSEKLVIGAGSHIRSHSIFYAGSRFGAGLRTGHRVTVRENTRAGEALQIGTLGDIQGHCAIGDHVRLHSNVHIGQRSMVGDFVFIFPYVVLTNDPTPPSEDLVGVTLEDFSIVATMSVVLPGARVGRGALVGAMSLVKGDVPPESIFVGNPGKVVGSTSKIKLRNGEPAYPWRRHFHRGYPDHVVEAWKTEFAERS
ncbi:MAG TPA: hypothetical protein VGC56_08195 [Allosphingosinicella sp.]|jgi:acetyltransferase-like isoleucine patch superfamily enzyme